MSCMFGNCNDSNCVNGSDSDVNGNPCDDASCAPCGSIAVTGGVAATTVAPNPSIVAANSSATPLTQFTNTLGQWGATITALATGQPSVVGQTGARTGVASVSPNQIMAGSSGMTMILLVVGVVIILVVISRR